MNKILVLLILSLFFHGLNADASAWRKKTKKAAKKETVTPASTSAYDDLVKTPGCHTVKGMITIHKKDGTIYFELPTSLLGREMLLGSTVVETASNEESIVGQKPHAPLHIFFSKVDSTIQLREITTLSVTDPGNDNIREALEKAAIGRILYNFPVEHWNNDSSAVVIDMTPFLVSNDVENLDPFDPYSASTYHGLMQRVPTYRDECSFAGDIKAFENNVSVTSHLTYTITMLALGMFEYQTDKPFTAVLNRSFLLLPEQPMRPRYLDPRIGIFHTSKIKYSDTDNRAKVIHYANRWRLEPVDKEAFRRGELVEPVKPIVFYVDTLFPETWKKYIIMGVEDWNLAFGKIGFKNVIRAVGFPRHDPEFDPGNIKYSCIRYAPIGIDNAMGPSWVDPRGGEIISASVYIYHNLVNLLYNWRIIQTGAVDPRVRAIHLPEDILGDAIRYVTRHEVGHCFGLMHNMAASHAFPTDSLRSATFTREHGTTPSIMDYARFNYVAQPGDLEKGVKLTPPLLGQYDLYAISWLYKPIPEAATAGDEIPVLDRWISEKAGDPVYRYGKQQIASRYDPSAVEEDLGDDPVKSAGYGIKNLKYVFGNIDKWVDADDIDYSFRASFHYSILNQYRLYLKHVDAMIGGIFLNERYEGDERPTFQPVSRAEQKRALQFLLEAQEDTDWLDENEYLENIPIVGVPGAFFQRSILNGLIEGTKRLILCAEKSSDPYTESEYLEDIYGYVWKPTIQGKKLSEKQMNAQLTFVTSLIKQSGITTGQQGERKTGWDIQGFDKWLDREMYKHFQYVPSYTREIPKPVGGVDFQRMVNTAYPSAAPVFYEFLMKVKAQLERSGNTGDEMTRAHYGSLLQTIRKALKNDD